MSGLMSITGFCIVGVLGFLLGAMTMYYAWELEVRRGWITCRNKTYKLEEFTL